MSLYVYRDTVTTPGIYHSIGLRLISLSSDGSTWVTISDRNLGALSIYNYGDTLSDGNCGRLYQRGNDYAFIRTTAPSTSSSTTTTSSYGPYYNYRNSTFIKASGDWSSSTNNNLWGDTTDTLLARQGPCDNGYHVPTKSEWENVANIGVSLGAWTVGEGGRINVMTYLKLPAGGSYSMSATFQYEGTRGEYWTSSVNSSNAANAYFFRIYSTKVQTDGSAYKTYGYSVRPFKDEPIVPDNTWTVLYPTS